MIKDEITFLRGLSKPLRNMSYDKISKLVNEEIKKVGEDVTFSELRDIDEKLGLPIGTAFEMGGFKDSFEFDNTSGD